MCTKTTNKQTETKSTLHGVVVPLTLFNIVYMKRNGALLCLCLHSRFALFVFVNVLDKKTRNNTFLGFPTT